MIYYYYYTYQYGDSIPSQCHWLDLWVNCSCTTVLHPSVPSPFAAAHLWSLFSLSFSQLRTAEHTLSPSFPFILIRSLAFLPPSSNVVWLFIQSGFSWPHMLCVMHVLFQRCNRLVTLLGYTVRPTPVSAVFYVVTAGMLWVGVRGGVNKEVIGSPGLGQVRSVSSL